MKLLTTATNLNVIMIGHFDDSCGARIYAVENATVDTIDVIINSRKLSIPLNNYNPSTENYIFGEDVDSDVIAIRQGDSVAAMVPMVDEPETERLGRVTSYDELRHLLSTY